MRVFVALIFVWLVSVPAFADGSCLGYEEWPSVVTGNGQVTVKVWYRPEHDGRTKSHVYIWYRYSDGRFEQGCVQLNGGGYTPKIYEWLKSSDPYVQEQARQLIEVQAIRQGVLLYAEPLGD